MLIGFSFPTVLFGVKFPNLGFLAWFGLVPLLWILKNATGKQAFFYGWFTALVYFTLSFDWIYVALHDYGYLNPVVSTCTLLLLAGTMALYIGFACFLVKWLEKKFRADFFTLFPFCFTLLEWARNYTPFNGFPWSNLAMSQSDYTWIIQIADLAGVYGVTFLIAGINAALAGSVRHLRVGVAVLLAFTLGYGAFRTNQFEKRSALAPHLRVGLIQPNIPQDEKWDASALAKQKGLFSDAVQSLQNHTDLIIWPETSWTEPLPLEQKFIFPKELGLREAADQNPFALLGATSIQDAGGETKYFNSALLLDGNGIILERYHKAHLVPFGEYIPMEKIFFFLKPLAVIGDFKAGSAEKPLSLGSWNLAPLICYEDIFPELSRAMAGKNAHLLVNMTNDAWYGVSSAAYQHLALAQFRSVETRRAMVRATNTGVSAVIDPSGRVVMESPLFERGVIRHQVPLLTGKTLYVRLGDWFVAACLACVILQMFKSKIQSPKSKTNPKTQIPGSLGFWI